MIMATCTHDGSLCDIYKEELLDAAPYMITNGICINCQHPVSQHPRRPEQKQNAPPPQAPPPQAAGIS